MSSFDMSFRKERHHYYAEYLKLQDDPISLKQQHYRKHPRFSYPHNNQLGIRAEKAILPGKALIIDLFKLFKMILNTLIVLRVLRFSRAIYRKDVGHGLISPGIGQQHMQGLCAVGQTLGATRPWLSGLAFGQLRLKLSCSLFVDGQLAPTADL